MRKSDNSEARIIRRPSISTDVYFPHQQFELTIQSDDFHYCNIVYLPHGGVVTTIYRMASLSPHDKIYVSFHFIGHKKCKIKRTQEQRARDGRNQLEDRQGSISSLHLWLSQIKQDRT